MDSRRVAHRGLNNSSVFDRRAEQLNIYFTKVVVIFKKDINYLTCTCTALFTKTMSSFWSYSLHQLVVEQESECCLRSIAGGPSSC